jgi:RNA polymerase sigma-70 factor (ECF subfamily)
MTYPPDSQSSWKRLTRRVERWTRRSGREEDLLQAAFVRLLAYQKPVLNPDSFLLRVATNLAIDEDRRERIHGSEPLSVDLQDMLACDDPLPDETLDSRHRLAAVTAALDTLPERTRRIFLMHRLDGFKYREIAQMERISVSAVEKHIAKAALFIGAWHED